MPSPRATANFRAISPSQARSRRPPTASVSRSIGCAPSCANATALAPILSILTTIFWPAPPIFARCSTTNGARGFLAAYNAGPGRYEDYLRGRPLPAETIAYVQRIAPALSLGGRFATSHFASEGGFASPIFVAIPEPQRRDGQPLKRNAEVALRVEGSTHLSLIPAPRDSKIFAINPNAVSRLDAASPAPLSHSGLLFAAPWPSGTSR